MKKRQNKNRFNKKGKNTKKIIVIIAIVLLILVFLFLSINLTGQIIGQISGDATSTQLYNCTDSDNGINYFENGVCNDRLGEHADACYSSKGLAEYYCGRDQYACIRQESACPFGCIDGACMKVLCADSDNGKNSEIKGVVILNDIEHEDYCFDSEYVIEYYCSGNSTYNSLKISCDNGCLDGACAPAGAGVEQSPGTVAPTEPLAPETNKSSYLSTVIIILIIIILVIAVGIFFSKKPAKNKSFVKLSRK
ncbi:MAG: hypothetical protein PHF67_04955 [Candidatus Nanoarchaeia archaeon]|nr:hypothetical protein [Candidatus Nanoarchaeia archaeon]